MTKGKESNDFYVMEFVKTITHILFEGVDVKSYHLITTEIYTLQQRHLKYAVIENYNDSEYFDIALYNNKIMLEIFRSFKHWGSYNISEKYIRLESIKNNMHQLKLINKQEENKNGHKTIDN